MSADFVYPNGLDLDIEFGYLNPAVVGAPKRHNPKVVLNTESTSALRTLTEELKHADSFLFSVAFVTSGAIALLKQEFVDFQAAGRRGQIVTADYLAFNSPEAFAELLNLKQLGIDVRIHPANGFHAKGYIFKRSDSLTAMVGSSNLTKSALVSNHEWNLKVSATPESDLGTQLSQLMRRQLDESTPLTAEWIETYTDKYVPPVRRPAHVVTPDAEPVIESEVIVPNKMQEVALASIAAVREAGNNRAIVISATGTGKTILSALDVRAFDPVRLLFVVHREQILDRTIHEYRRALGGSPDQYGKLTGSVKQGDRRYVFATVQTLSQPGVLEGFAPEAFDYVIIDEAHRAGSPTHRSVIDYFKPKFLLGMTATPERTDGFNVFELFDYNVPYEIRLNHALEEEMLSPFHYYGVADLTFEDGRTTTDETELKVLISPERVDHLLKALELYGQAGVPPRGLIFCSHRDEARALSDLLNARTLRGRTLRTIALTGDDSIAYREEHVAALERGELDYILTVDIFNEGVDIPTVNQVVMLRQTQSAIVFVQQLGRGLRKAENKEYLVVIDFIGNYANNFLIPIALFGDESLNKESLRQNLIAAEEAGVLPGLSSVSFDRIAQERVLRSIAETKLDSLQNIKKSIDILRNRLGHLPALTDFLRFESVDPVLAATKMGSYPSLLKKLYKLDPRLPANDLAMLELISSCVFPARRAHELLVLQQALATGQISIDHAVALLHDASQLSGPDIVSSVFDSFTLERHHAVTRRKYGTPVAVRRGDELVLTDEFAEAYKTNEIFREAIDDLIATGLEIAARRYDPTRPVTPGLPYTLQESLRLLTLPHKDYATVFGYKIYRDRGVCPIYVTLHKPADGAASTAYQDELIDTRSMRWSSKNNRTLASQDVRDILSGEIALHVFVKKDDVDGAGPFYLGEATASDPKQTTMPDDKGRELDVVHMLLRFAEPIDSALFDYFHPTLTA